MIYRTVCNQISSFGHVLWCLSSNLQNHRSICHIVYIWRAFLQCGFFHVQTCDDVEWSVCRNKSTCKASLLCIMVWSPIFLLVEKVLEPKGLSSVCFSAKWPFTSFGVANVFGHNVQEKRGLFIKWVWRCKETYLSSPWCSQRKYFVTGWMF